MRDQLPSFRDQDSEINQNDRINTRSLLSGSDNTALKLIMPTLTSIIDRLENDKKLNDQKGIKQSIENERLLARTQLQSNSVDSLIIKQTVSVDLLKELLDVIKGQRRTADAGGVGDVLSAAGGAGLLAALAGLLPGAKIAIVAALAAGGLRVLLGDEEVIQRREDIQTQQQNEIRRQTPQVPTDSPAATGNIPHGMSREDAERLAFSYGHQRGSPDYERIIEEATRTPQITPVIPEPPVVQQPPAARQSSPTVLTPEQRRQNFRNRGSSAPATAPTTSVPQATPERHSSLDSGIMDALTSGFDRGGGSETGPRIQGTMYAQAPDQSGVMSDAQPDATRIEEPAPETPVAMAEPQTTTQQEGVRETNRDLTFGPGVDRRIEQGIASKVGQIESSFGKRLIVTSGHRDAARNARVGGARNSAHTRGNAVDVAFSGNVQDTIKLIEVASSAGIGGIGVYRPGWVHLDTENKRVWGPDFSARSIPQWARRALDAHMTGRRDGAQATPVEAPAEQPHAEPAEQGEMGGGELMSGTTAPSATPTAGTMPTGGMQVMQASQENAVAERTPSPPAVAPSMSTPAGDASPGTPVPTTQQSSTDPGRVEPEDAAERYARMFNMAA
jgi:hypothetical protein